MYIAHYVNYIAWTCSMVQTQAVDVPHCSYGTFTRNVAYIFMEGLIFLLKTP